MSKKETSAEEPDDLSNGFDRDRVGRQRELTNNKIVDGKYDVRIGLRNVFGFAEHQEKARNGLDFSLTSTGNKITAVLNKAGSFADARIKNGKITCYVPLYTPSISQQVTLSKQISSKTPMVLRYYEQSVSMVPVNIHNLWNFQLGSQQSMDVPIWITVGLQQRDWRTLKI